MNRVALVTALAAGFLLGGCAGPQQHPAGTALPPASPVPAADAQPPGDATRPQQPNPDVEYRANALAPRPLPREEAVRVAWNGTFESDLEFTAPFTGGGSGYYSYVRTTAIEHNGTRSWSGRLTATWDGKAPFMDSMRLTVAPARGCGDGCPAAIAVEGPAPLALDLHGYDTSGTSGDLMLSIQPTAFGRPASPCNGPSPCPSRSPAT